MKINNCVCGGRAIFDYVIVNKIYYKPHIYCENCAKIIRHPGHCSAGYEKLADAAIIDLWNQSVKQN